MFFVESHVRRGNIKETECREEEVWDRGKTTHALGFNNEGVYRPIYHANQ